MSHPDQPPIEAYDLSDPVDRRKAFEAECKVYRHQISVLGTDVKCLIHHSRLNDPEPGASPEIAANIILAFRHLEDARMRLGKAIQASDGGKSVYND